MISQYIYLGYFLFLSSLLCSINAQDAGPSMRMYFHGGINDYLMFESWVPKSELSYVAGWFLFFFLTVSLEGVLVYGHNVQDRWLKESEKESINDVFSTNHSLEAAPVSKTNSFLSLSTIITWYRALLLSIFRAIESTLAYFLMLVTMIYNTGLFFSVVSGHAVGVFLFSRFRTKSSSAVVPASPFYGNSLSGSSRPVLDSTSPTYSKNSNEESPSSCH